MLRSSALDLYLLSIFTALSCQLNLITKMNVLYKKTPAIPASLFWDTDYEKIDWQANAPYVIERVLSRGSWEDFKTTLNYYSNDAIKKAVTHFRYLDKLTLAFCSTYFDIPITNFRCYNYKLSNPKHWDY